jgi:phenylacetate-CoA ligase
VRRPDELGLLPILTRQEARASLRPRTSEVPPAPTIRKTTGGTTGEPLVICYDEGAESWRQAMKLRGFGWAGYRVGDRALHYWGEPTRPDRRLSRRAKVLVDRALKREHYLDCTPRSERDLAAAVARIQRLRPAAIFCYAQAGADLARYINRTGARDWGTIAVICGAERVMPHDRAALTEAFGPAVFETYGCREVTLIASECEEHAGLHLSVENLLVELVVRDGGRERPAAPGEVGEVVLTDLHNHGMPLIRYANGDLAVAMSEGRCGCGRTLPRLASVEGRSTETLRDAAGNPVGGMVFNLIVSPLAAAVRQFQAVQRKDGAVVLRVVPAPELGPGTLDHVRDRCRRYLPGVPVHIELVEHIPAGANGKRQVVIVERDDDRPGAVTSAGLGGP